VVILGLSAFILGHYVMELHGNSAEAADWMEKKLMCLLQRQEIGWWARQPVDNGHMAQWRPDDGHRKLQVLESWSYM
jgi:hypothetical protein